MNDTESQLAILRTLALDTNVNSVTLLATDYLNHFNEALMLAELLVDMPDMLEDFAAWAPKGYQDHFRDSGIADRQLAIDAYDFAPPEYKMPFEATIDQLNLEITDLQDGLSLGGDPSPISGAIHELDVKCDRLRKLIDRAGGIINGQVMDDGLFTRTSAPDQNDNRVSAEETLGQGDIDALFD